MNFNISSFKVVELARIFDIKTPHLSRRFKDMKEPFIEKNNNRITGISPDEVERYFRSKGHNSLFKTSIHLVNSTVGGTSKTSTSIALLGALRRITAIHDLKNPSRKKACIIIDLDSQASLSSTVLGNPTPDHKPIILDYFEKRASLNQILKKVNNSKEIYCIGSNLNNIYLDKLLTSPKAIKQSMKQLLDEIIDRFGDGCRIVIDTPPQLSQSMSSTVCALAQFIKEKRDYSLGIIIPIRPDDYALKGAKISCTESKEVTSTFNLPEVPIYCFVSAFDKRLKIGLEIMKNLFQDETLRDHINPIMVRYSSEISKANMKKESIFSGKITNATTDYQELALSLLGYTNQKEMQ